MRQANVHFCRQIKRKLKSDCGKKKIDISFISSIVPFNI